MILEAVLVAGASGSSRSYYRTRGPFLKVARRLSPPSPPSEGQAIGLSEHRSAHAWCRKCQTSCSTRGSHAVRPPGEGVADVCSMSM